MANAPDKPVGRRRFLSKAAAGTAGLVATPRLGSSEPENPLANEQDQGRQNAPSDVALRVKALESILATALEWRERIDVDAILPRISWQAPAPVAVDRR